MRKSIVKIIGADGYYHCMTRTVNGEMLFENRDKEKLRRMLWQIADFSGVEVLTYCLMDNHFHVLVSVPFTPTVSDTELMRRYRMLYPKPTKYQTASISVMEKKLTAGGEEAEAIRIQLLARMGDVSQFMKTLKQRFTIWFNHTHERFGTLWSERFKSVLVEGKGNPLQTMAAYIDLNPVRAGIVEDPKDYRFCGYAEAVAGTKVALSGLCRIWADFDPDPTRAHRMLLFGKGMAPSKKISIDPMQAARILEKEGGKLSKSEVLRCRVRYFSDGAILGSREFVAGYIQNWQATKGRKYRPKVNDLQGGDWGDLAVIQRLRRRIIG